MKGLRIGVPEEYFGAGIDPEVARSVRAAIAALEKEGCVVRGVKLPHTRFAVATYYVIATAEASSNLARFDGVRYGLQVEDVAPISRKELRLARRATRASGAGGEVGASSSARSCSARSTMTPTTLKAQKVRTLLCRDFDERLSRGGRHRFAHLADARRSRSRREGRADPLAMYLSDITTRSPASASRGSPSMSLPAAQPTRRAGS